MKYIGVSCDGLVKVYFIEYHINDYVYFRFNNGKLIKKKINDGGSFKVNEFLSYEFSEICNLFNLPS